MALRRKIDSNETSLSYAEEESIGVLPTTPVWKPLEPNSYDDTGGDVGTVARNPINAGRSRKKGRPVSLDVAAGFEQDFTLENSPDIMQGFFFADAYEQPSSAVTATQADKYMVPDETAFIPSSLILASDFATAATNGLKKIAGTGAGYVGVTGVAAHAETGKIMVVGYEGDAADFAITSAGGTIKLTSADLDFVAAGLTAGEWIYIGGDAAGTRFATAGNNGFKRIRAVTAGAVTIDQSDTAMSADAGTGKTIRLFFGTFLKNETDPTKIKRRSYHLERTLGAPDTAHLDQIQAEYMIGSVPSQLKVNIEVEDKITMSMSFVAIDNEQVDAAAGLKGGTRTTIAEVDAFNTSSDFSSMRMSVVDPANNSPLPLFAYVTSMSFTIDNSLTANKAVGVFGAFDVTAGTFMVSAETEAYFNDVAAIAAVRKSRDVQLYAALAMANTGMVVDLPLITLGGGKLNIAQDEPIKVPLTADAATAAKLNGDMTHTCSFTFFKYLPTIAG